MVKLQTIDELEAIYYGHNRNLLRKADAPVTTSTQGVFNAVFGAYAWAQLNLEANAWGILPKYPWDKSGWRIITSKADSLADKGSGNNTALGGTVEGGLIADTIKPSIEEVDIRPKTVHLPFNVTETLEYLANHSKDDIWGGLGSLRLFMAVQFKELLNRQLLADAEAAAAGAGADYAGTLNLEPVDRVISSDAEEDYAGGTYNNWYDPWNKVDRDSATKYDCTVQSPSGTIGTQAVLTDDALRTFLTSYRTRAGKDPTVFLGSYDVYQEIQGLYMPSVRIPNPYGESLVQVDVNGIKTFKGTGVGIHIDTIYGIPFIPTKDAPKYAAGELGRLYAFDTSDPEGFGYSRLGIRVAIPIEYFEASRRTPGYPYINEAFVEKGLFRLQAETVCTSFIGQGKIRDIKK